jgi:site-specific recombinase XerD
MNEVFLSIIIEKAREAVQGFGYKQSTIRHYERYWKSLSNYSADFGGEMFSEQLVDQYVSDLKQQLDSGKIGKSKYKMARRAAYFVKDCFVNKNLTWRRLQNRTQNIKEPAFLRLQTNFVHQLQKEQKSNGTIRIYGRIIEQFLEYLELKGLHDISEVTPQDVSAFIPHISPRYPKGVHVVLPTLRSFLKYLEMEKLITAHLVWAVPQNSQRITPLVSNVTNEEIQKLLNSVERDNPLGKRDYAILLLAARTGLRRADISNLRLCDINWKRSTIELTQKKTNNHLILPLLTDVGNAIADYILNARPKVDSPYVFLRHFAPYKKINSSTCYDISSKAMDKSEIHQNEGERKGLHCFRHSIATRLLENETPLSVISSILGHKSKDSTKIYLSTDLKNLRFCALGLTGIEVAKEELL